MYFIGVLTISGAEDRILETFSLQDGRSLEIQYTPNKCENVEINLKELINPPECVKYASGATLATFTQDNGILYEPDSSISNVVKNGIYLTQKEMDDLIIKSHEAKPNSLTIFNEVAISNKLLEIHYDASGTFQIDDATDFFMKLPAIRKAICRVYGHRWTTPNISYLVYYTDKSIEPEYRECAICGRKEKLEKEWVEDK